MYEVSSELHVLAALNPGKESPVLIWYEVGWAPEPVWTTWRSENSWTYRDSNSDPSVVHPVSSRCTDCATYKKDARGNCLEQHPLASFWFKTFYLELKHAKTSEGGVLRVMENLYNSKLICWQFKTNNYHISGVNLELKYRKIMCNPLYCSGYLQPALSNSVQRAACRRPMPTVISGSLGLFCSVLQQTEWAARDGSACQTILSRVWVTTDEFWIVDRIYWILGYSAWLHFTIHYYIHTH
jgi:hypothetical protein